MRRLADLALLDQTQQSALESMQEALDTLRLGSIRCREFSIAITKLEEAMMWIQRPSGVTFIPGTLAESFTQEVNK